MELSGLEITVYRFREKTKYTNAFLEVFLDICGESFSIASSHGNPLLI